MTNLNLDSLKKRLIASANAIDERFILFLKQEIASNLKGAVCSKIQRLNKKISNYFLRLDNSDGHGRISIFPEGVRFLYSSPNAHIVVIEEKPKVRSLRVMEEQNQDFFNKVPKTYSLSLPYVVHVISFEGNENRINKGQFFPNLYTAFRPHPLQSVDDVLQLPNLPNIAFDLRVCLGEYAKNIFSINSQADLIKSAQDVVKEFWSSYFNEQHGASREYLDLNMPEYSYSVWEANSRKNPIYGVQCPWLDSDYTLIDTIKECLNSVELFEFSLSSICDSISEITKADSLANEADIKKSIEQILKIHFEMVIGNFVAGLEAAARDLKSNDRKKLRRLLDQAEAHKF